MKLTDKSFDMEADLRERLRAWKRAAYRKNWLSQIDISNEKLPVEFDIGWASSWTVSATAKKTLGAERPEGVGYAAWVHPKLVVVCIRPKGYYWIGKNSSDQDVIDLLADVQREFHILFRDVRPEWTERQFETSATPNSIYEGFGRVFVGEKSYRVWIEFECPWPPPNCELIVKTENVTKTVLSCYEPAEIDNG